MRQILKKITNELENKNPNIEYIKENLSKIEKDYNDLEQDYNDLEKDKEELEDVIYDLEFDLNELKKEVEEFKHVSENEHTLDDYFMDKIVSEIREKWRFSSTKLEQKLKESDII